QAALAALHERRFGVAALWAERARRVSPRDPFVRSVRRVLDEEGALPGHPEGLGTVLTWQEAAVAAAAFWCLAAWVWAWAGSRKGRTPKSARILALFLVGAAVLSGIAALAIGRSGFDGSG